MGGRGASSGIAVAGVTVSIRGKQETYYLRNGKLQNSHTLRFMPGDGKTALNKLVQSGGKPLTAKQVQRMTANRAEDRARTPDYETGNPFNERGKKKLVYRPRRSR